MGLFKQVKDMKEAVAAAPARVSFADSVASSFRSNILNERRYLLILDGLKTTALISVLATLFGTALGALVCYMRMSPLALLQAPVRAKPASPTER